ncbi:atypical/PIKK/ATR protein kinase [Vittaforma corneae ATCC 50505]|uniref:Atypical/PIKK/ATR protein kinase n=1 Tax=Vittaforma corneae (strain ATCC 50505) TaxID=993615 RepID=L2GLA8_VITCO|nr:atypical/PIKK/ATR protein kinase [Vittaforma corneae ATCC 50505]ELA41621.1 atypical/PIKK/ATR protein kinase [Vittaforma corneae ATCC 50505]
MSPYLIDPFEKIEDIPYIPNLEVKIYEMLARYFSDEKRPFRYNVCPFDTTQKDGANNSQINEQGNKNKHCKNSNANHDQLTTININTGLNNGLLALYNSIKDHTPQYTTPKEQVSQSLFISDHVFIEKFLFFYEKSKIFRNLVHSLKPSSLPIHTKALFGDIKYSYTNYDTIKQNSAISFSDVSDISKSILEKFLLKINYERQDLFAFTIQEFLKSIKGGFDPETENFIQQFRHTKFEYKFTLKPAKEMDLSSYRSFLESVFSILYSKTKKFQFMKYLVLFDDCTLEFSCLCLIKIVLHGTCDINDDIADKNDICDLFNDIDTSNPDILRFLLEINTFIGKPVVSRKSYLDYALKARDYYSLIYCLEDKETDIELLQIAYYMINDTVRVKGFNTNAPLYTSSQFTGVQNSEYSTLNLFFDLILGKNYKAAQQCLEDLSANTNITHSTPNSVRSFDKLLTNFGSFSISPRDVFISKILREILECNESEEVENILLGKDPDIVIHILKDLELLINMSKIGDSLTNSSFSGIKLCNEDSHSGNMSANGNGNNSTIVDTVRLIEKRRKISKNPDLLLKVHKYLESKIHCKEFSRSVDLELIKYLMKKKEFQKAEEEIARIVLKKEYSVLYDHSLIKIEQKHQNEAKELLRRMRLQCPEDSIDYFKATVKLCEIGQSKGMFEEGISDLERILNDKINGCDNNDSNGIDAVNDISKINGNTNGNITFINTAIANGIAPNNSANKKKRGNASIINLAYDKLKADNTNIRNNASINMQNLSEYLGHIQRLYFLTAKYFEKHDALVSIKYYFKSFTSNHEAIPRFFHLIANIPRTHMKIVGEMIETIKKEYLSNLIPFYNQISTKLSLETDTVKFYKEIVSTMLEKYPYQTHWNTLFLFNSKKTEVSKVLVEIIENLSLERRKLFMDIKNCSEKFASIARHNGTKLCMEKFPDIRSLFPAKINVPGQLTEINNIKNDIVVFRSLQMPKKITLVGEDGREYPMIVKFKDDLRKDSRFMDLDNLLNKLFISDEYYIRKYNVIPFNHESGIIEFVPNLYNLKEIVHTYHEITHETVQKFLRTKMIGTNNMASLMERFKPVYNRYLKETYTDPYQFYRCRESYIRTYAIMNIVGWFMGLGDRHSENIHFDRMTGDTVHVDLNCIFDKAKSLEIPEKVPFRLTQNIIDGFGVLKLEGTYKHTLKYTLEVLRNNRDVIQANLLSFVFDPLFEWARRKTEPVKIIDGMNKKLDFEDVDFKVEELIGEATDINNLGSMYIGWMAFI